MRVRYLLALVIIGLLSLGLFTSTARAGGDVTVCDEAHLRSALSGGGLVTFSCSGVITLSSPVGIVDDTTIDGSGETVTISGDNRFNVLNVGNVNVTVPAVMSPAPGV